jgi:hypothetical protein
LRGEFEKNTLMKSLVTIVSIFVTTLCMAQDNKFETGDFGMRYSVAFNGTVLQGLTFSGMATANIEVGSGINVQYSNTATTTNSASFINPYINGVYTPVPAASTYQNTSRTINTSLTPFAYYHFKIKNNLDIYTGPNLLMGTGSHTLFTRTDNMTIAVNYSSNTLQRTTYPLGYQVGGGWNIGGQYFFYKRLAIGMQASLGVAYSNTNGTEKSVYSVSNSGTYNGSTQNASSTVYGQYVSKGLSLTTGSSIGVTLTFYLARKDKVLPDPKY